MIELHHITMMISTKKHTEKNKVPGAQGPVMMGAPNGSNGVAGPCGSCGSFGAMMGPANGQMQPVPW